MENKNTVLQEQQIAKMQYLMDYGRKVNESKNSSSSSLEYSELAADGNTYGILKECHKFYIKVANPKNTPILAEDFDYIGGYMRKKDNEFESYASAYKHLGLKTKAINEDCQRKNRVMVEMNNRKKLNENASWKNEETQEMRELMESMSFAANDFNRICENVENIKQGRSMITETAVIKSKEVPEKPAGYSTTVRKTYTEKGEYKPNMDGAAKSHKVVKDTFTDNVGDVDSKLASEKNPSVNGTKVFGQKPVIGIKGTPVVTKGNVTESEVNCWDTDPDDLSLDPVAYGKEKVNTPTPYENEIGDAVTDIHPSKGCCKDGKCDDEEVVYEIEIGEDVLGESFSTHEINGGVPSFGNGEHLYKGTKYSKGSGVKKGDKKPFESTPSDELEGVSMPSIKESRNIQGGKKNMTQNVNWGKHPRYKKPFAKAKAGSNTGANGEKDLFTSKAGSEAPYGTKKGSSYPFTQIVESITDRVMESLGF